MPRYTYTKKLIVYGYVNEGDVVQYKDSRTNTTLLSGRIQERGVMVEGQDEPVSLAKFEALAGRYKVNQATKHIYLPSGKSVDAALNEINRLLAEAKKTRAREAAARPGKRRGRKPKVLQEYEDGAGAGAGAGAAIVDNVISLLTEAENDEYCVYCGIGGGTMELMRCSSCPTAMHARCPTVEDILQASKAAARANAKVEAPTGDKEDMEDEEDSDAEAVAVKNALKRRKEARKRSLQMDKMDVDTGTGAGEVAEMGDAREAGGSGEASTAPATAAGATSTAGAVGAAPSTAPSTAPTAAPTQAPTTHSKTEWHCPACSCCVCGERVSPVAEQYRGALRVGPDVLGQPPYVDVLDPEHHKKLVIGDPIPTEAEEEHKAEEKPRASDVDIEGNGADNEDNKDGSINGDNEDESLLPPPPPPPVETSLLVSATGARAHAKCSKQFPTEMSKGAPFDVDGDLDILQGLAKACLRGATNIGRYSNDESLSFQMIHAAAATGQTVHGVAPVYTSKQRISLRKIISAGWAVVKDSYEEIWDSRTGLNLAPMMLQGTSNLPYVDYSGMHIAAMFINSCIVSVACFRVLGPVVEVPIVATRRDLRGIKAASTLLARLDHELHKLGVKALVTQATYKEGPNSYFPYTPSLNPPGAPMPPPGQEALGFKLARKEYVDAVISRGGFSVPGITWVERDTGKWADWSTWEAESQLSNIQVKLNALMNLRSRLQLMMIKGVHRPKPDVKTETEMPTEMPTQQTQQTTPDHGNENGNKDDNQNGKVVVDPMVTDATADVTALRAKHHAENGTAPRMNGACKAVIDVVEAMDMDVDIETAATGQEKGQTDDPMQVDRDDGTERTVVRSLVDSIISRVLAST